MGDLSFPPVCYEIEDYLDGRITLMVEEVDKWVILLEVVDGRFECRAISKKEDLGETPGFMDSFETVEDVMQTYGRDRTVQLLGEAGYR